MPTIVIWEVVFQRLPGRSSAWAATGIMSASDAAATRRPVHEEIMCSPFWIGL
jgi:hypothetical protein